MAKVRIRAIYDPLAREDQLPLVVETSYGPVILAIGSAQDFEIEKITDIRVSTPEDATHANEATKPVSDPSVLQEQAVARGQGTVRATPPEKPVGEQTLPLANAPEKTSTEPSPSQSNISERQPEVQAEGGLAPHPQRGMVNSLTAAERQREVDPLALLK